MFSTLKRVRLPLLAAGALALGTVVAAGAAASLGPPPASVAGTFAAPGLALGGAAALPIAPQTAAASGPAAPSASQAPARVRRAGHDASAGGSGVDPRLLAMPLAERYTQLTTGASNPGRRRGAPETPMTGMLAAVFQEDQTTSTSAAGNPSVPPVNPPPPGGDGGDDTCEPDDGVTCEPGPPTGVPEIDGNLLGAGLLLLIGGAAVLASRR